MTERQRTYLIIGAVVAVILIIAFAVVATIFGWWPVVVDIVLVVTALTSLALLAGLIYAVLSLTRTVLRIRDELMPTLESLKTTSATVRETARTASSFGVRPAVQTASAMLSASSVASVVFGRGEARTRSERRQRRRLELEREQLEQERLEQERAALDAAAWPARHPIPRENLDGR